MELDTSAAEAERNLEKVLGELTCDCQISQKLIRVRGVQEFVYDVGLGVLSADCRSELDMRKSAGIVDGASLFQGLGVPMLD